MSTQTPTPTRPDWTEVLDARRQNVSYALIGVAGVLVVAAAVLMWKYQWDAAALVVGFLLFGLTALGCGLWFLGGTAGGLSGRDSARLLGLVVGGTLGLALAVGGIWQTIVWWSYIVGSTPETEEVTNPWRTWVVVGVVLAGLVLMFGSLLLARSEESDNPSLRRLLYGYVAVLTGLLLAGILVGLNILAYFYLPKSADWTEAGIYTLSNKSENVLKGLKQPVKVYVMEQQRGDRFDVDMRDLIDNAKAVTDKIQAEYLVRDVNVSEMSRLKEQYKPDDDLGLIVVYGNEDNAPHTFIPVREVLPPPPFNPMGRQSQEQSFQGEDRLVSAITFLEEGKKKPVLYFTQGNGELDLFGLAPGARPSQRGQALLDRLQQRGNYEVKGLMLAVEGPADSADKRLVVSKEVPADADVVIVGGPTKPLAQGTIDALRKYMNEPRKEKDPLDDKKARERKGKLMVLAGVVAGPDDKMAPLGLDRLLADYDVEVTNERVLRATRDARPERVMVTPNPDLKGKNPLATLFEGVGVYMNDVRVVRPHTAGARPGEAPKFQASELLSTAHPIYQQSYVFAETDLRPAADVLADYFANAGRRAELQKKLTTTLPVAVAVSEPGAPDPADPHAGLMGGTRGEGPPRLVVIGDTAFASNEAIGGRAGREEGASVNYDLFASAVAWLREKPSSMGIEPKKRGKYTMRQDANLRAMMLLPVGLMAFAVVGLGLGVWVVRRLNCTNRDDAMNLKTTYILFGVLLAVLLLFAATQFSGCEKAGTEKEGFLFAAFHAKKSPVKTGDIDTVRIERPADHQTLVFTREKNEWRMTEPYPLRTDTYQVNRVVDEVSGAKREQSEMSSSLEQYGLKEPQIVVTLKKGDEEWKLNVGSETGKNGVVYVTTGAKPNEPVAVSRPSLDAVFNKVNDFRDKALLTANATNASAVELGAKGSALALEKVGEGRWRFLKPAYGPANTDSDAPAAPAVGEKKVGGVRDLIDDAGGLRVESNDDFVAEGVSDADLVATYGLDKGKPETLRIEVKIKPPEGEAKTEALLIGKKAPKLAEVAKDDKKDTKKEDKKPDASPEYYYVRLESENSVERVPAAKVKPLLDVLADPSALRSRDLVNVGAASKIDAIDISAGGSAVKLRQADNKWTLYHGGARPTDEGAVRELVDAITGKKKVLTFVDKEDGLNFDKPSAVVSVWIDGVKKEEKKDEEKKDGEKKDGDKPAEKKEEKKDDKEPALTSDKPSVKLTFGKRDRDKGLVYVRRESGEDKSVVTVSDAVLDKVTAGPLTYLDRKLPSFTSGPFNPAQDVTKLTLVRGGQTWELAKEKSGDKEVWKIVQPQALAGRGANAGSVGDVLRDLATLRAEKVVAEKPSEADLDQLYGLKKPETTVTVTVKKDDKTDEWVYSFGKQSDTKMGVYARLNKSDLVFLVPKATADHITAADLRDLTVFNFDMSKVKGATITVWSNDLGAPINLVLERKGDNDWVKKDGPITPDGAKVENFIRTLSHLQASKFVTPKPNVDTGLDVAKKALKVEVTVGDETLDLLVGNEDPDNKGMLFASSSKLKGDVFLVPEAMFKDAKASPAYFRK